jgi:hypothetical protein
MLAISPTLQHNIPVLISDKEIYPINNSKTDKIQFIRIAKFIFATHLPFEEQINVGGFDLDVILIDEK